MKLLHLPSAPVSAPRTGFRQRFKSALRPILDRVLAGSDDSAAGFAVRVITPETRYVTVRADGPRLIQIVIELVRNLPQPLGVALVAYRAEPEEWVHGTVGRGRVLEMLLGLGDLTGRGHFDLAIFSQAQEMEIILDRYGVLEVRGASWNLPHIRGAALAAGLEERKSISPIPGAAPPPIWDSATTQRVAHLRDWLELVLVSARDA